MIICDPHLTVVFIYSLTTDNRILTFYQCDAVNVTAMCMSARQLLCAAYNMSTYMGDSV